MAWWHRVGQRVVVKRDMSEDPSWLGDTGWEDPLNSALNLPLGSVWIVRSLRVDEDGDVIFEVEGSVDEYWANYFAPVKDTSIESLRALLDEPPDPALVREEADARFVEKQRAREKARMDGLLYLQLKSDPDLLKRMRDAVWRGPKG